MKIVILTRNFVGFGGIPHSLKYISTGWKEQNLQHRARLNYIVLEDADKQLLEETRDNSVDVIHFNTHDRIKQFLKIYKILRKDDYDYVVCTCFRTYMFAKIVAPFNKIIMWFRGSGYLNTFFKKAFFNITNNTTSLVNSYYTANINNVKNYKVIYNGVSDNFLKMDSSDFYTRFNIPKSAVVIGFIGGWCWWKNHITLVKAFNLIAEKHKDTYLVCMGEHSELTKKAWEEVKYKERVRFQDRITYASRYLKYFDVYVHPSHKEGFGNAVVEAMYAGCPIVAANAGALPELIEDNVNGILYENATSSINCFHAIEKILSNENLARNLSCTAKKKANSCFSSRIFAKKFLGAFE